MLTLRQYQREAVDAVCGQAAKGNTRSLVVLPTGTGKTVVFGALAMRAQRRTLVLAHREELLEQAKDKIGMVWPEAEVGIVQGQRNEAHARDVVVASVPTLSSPRRLAAIGKFGLVVVDEAHHSVSSTWQRALEAVGVFERDGPICCGVTATPGRMDERGLGRVYQTIAYERSIPWMMARGYLSDMRALLFHTKISLDGVKISKSGDFDPAGLALVLNTANCNELIVESFLEHGSGRRGIAFTATVQHAADLADAFTRNGVPAAYVAGSSSKSERRGVLSAFRAGRVRIVCNAAVLTEGFDDPAVSAVLLARPTRSPGLYLQMIGRGLRIDPRKRDCLLFDYVHACQRHRVAGLPCLVGEKDHERAVEQIGLGESVVEALKRERGERIGLPLGDEVVVEEIGNVIARSSLHWEPRGKNLWLSVGDGDSIVLSAISDDLYEVGLSGRRGWRLLADRPLDIGFATGVAEDYVREHGLSWTAKDAPWRGKPVSDKQRETLARFGVGEVPATRGEANDLISQLIAGVRT